MAVEWGKVLFTAIEKVFNLTISTEYNELERIRNFAYELSQLLWWKQSLSEFEFDVFSQALTKHQVPDASMGLTSNGESKLSLRLHTPTYDCINVPTDKWARQNEIAWLEDYGIEMDRSPTYFNKKNHYRIPGHNQDTTQLPILRFSPKRPAIPTVGEQQWMYQISVRPQYVLIA